MPPVLLTVWAAVLVCPSEACVLRSGWVDAELSKADCGRGKGSKTERN